MILEKIKTTSTIAISISESPDMEVLGLSERHLQDAAAKIALRLLSSGRSLAYGGDLRTKGFTDLLFELALRYRGHPHHNGIITVTNYLAWPIHISMTTAELEKYVAEYHGTAQLVLIGEDGKRLSMEDRKALSSREPDASERSNGLTAMRQVMCEETDARILLGGHVEDYKGRMPGIAEEALLSLQVNQPVFLIGGFGGCTRDIAETVGLVEPWTSSRQTWSSRERFKSYSPDSLHNGLSTEENQLLVQTPYIDQSMSLVMKGLHRLLNSKTKDDLNQKEGNYAQGVY